MVAPQKYLPRSGSTAIGCTVICTFTQRTEYYTWSNISLSEKAATNDYFIDSTDDYWLII